MHPPATHLSPLSRPHARSSDLPARRPIILRLPAPRPLPRPTREAVEQGGARFGDQEGGSARRSSPRAPRGGAAQERGRSPGAALECIESKTLCRPGSGCEAAADGPCASVVAHIGGGYRGVRGRRGDCIRHDGRLEGDNDCARGARSDVSRVSHQSLPSRLLLATPLPEPTSALRANSLFL